MEKEKIKDLLIDWLSDVYIDFSQFGKKKEKIERLFYDYWNAWQELEADEDGFTKEQEKNAEKLDKEYINKIYEVLKND